MANPANDDLELMIQTCQVQLVEETGEVIGKQFQLRYRNVNEARTQVDENLNVASHRYGKMSATTAQLQALKAWETENLDVALVIESSASGEFEILKTREVVRSGRGFGDDKGRELIRYVNELLLT